MTLHLQPAQLPADGVSESTLIADTLNDRESLKGQQPALQFSGTPHSARLQSVQQTPHGWRMQIQAGIMPGEAQITVMKPGLSPASVPLTLQPVLTDTFRDGAPDFLRLDDSADQAAFRRWFTFLAEIQYFTPAPDRPAEIVDCSALLRYAYREALRRHDSSWCNSLHLTLVPALNSVEKYTYPQTPLGANLFRLRPGPFTPADGHNGTFGQFADAETLRRFNTFFVSRDMQRALPGDLLFYRRPAEHSLYHSMIVVGQSQITAGTTNYVVYNTGPDGTKSGEMRRRSVEELLNYPDPQWQPRWTNPNFLGVFRWNILRTTS